MPSERVQQTLDRYGLKALSFEPGSTPTAQLAADRLEVEVGQIAKSMLLAGKDGKFRLAVLRGDKKVHSGKIKALTGVKHRMASAQETQRVTGFKIGGVCPFGINGLEILLDQGLAGYRTIYPAAGTDSSCVPLDLDQLVSITAGLVCDLTQD